MPLRFRDLWRWQGTMQRSTYALAGLFALLVKFAIDKAIASIFFGRSWYPWSYWSPFGGQARLNALPHDDREFAITLLLLAIPFIWLGVTLTVQRLRDAGRPLWLVALFFVPLLNLILFAILCLLPTDSKSNVNQAAPWPETHGLDSMIPRSKVGAGLFAIGLSSVFGAAFTVMGVEELRDYGLGLFVALPFCLGLFAVLVYSYHAPRSFKECLTVSLVPVGLVAFALLFLAMEGIVCILMAAPLAGVLAILGGSLGYAIQSSHWRGKEGPVMLSVILLFSPSLMGLEHLAKPQPETFEVRTAIDVNAPPERVWKQLVAFSEIAPPTEMIFRAGVAYPIRAEITGHGVGAVRHCVFSTGAFVEPIEVWDEPHLLRFGVTDNPAPMQELTPYTKIEPPHLHGYFVSHQGQFLLTELPDGRTRLEGTTWYSHTIWPETYWHLWSDYIIHRIHMRVLEHIRTEAERSESD